MGVQKVSPSMLYRYAHGNTRFIKFAEGVDKRCQLVYMPIFAVSSVVIFTILCNNSQLTCFCNAQILNCRIKFLCLEKGLPGRYVWSLPTYSSYVHFHQITIDNANQCQVIFMFLHNPGFIHNKFGYTEVIPLQMQIMVQ